jgi:hypothetical protein
MGVHAEAIRLNDLGHEAVVSAVTGSHPPDLQGRQLLMSALEAAEEAGADNPKAQAERVIALVNLDLFMLLQQDGSEHEAYTKAIQDALDATGRAFDGTPSDVLEVTRMGHVWYTLGFQQQALGQFQQAVGLYQMASQTAMAVPEGQRDLRLLILVATNIAACAEKLGMADLATQTRAHVANLFRLLGESGPT